MLGTHCTGYLYSSWKQGHSSCHLVLVISACFFFVSSGLLASKVCTEGEGEVRGEILASKELKKETLTTELFLCL